MLARREPQPLSDHSYSGFDHLFFPQERSPTAVFPSSGGYMIGGVLAGGDRLGLQRWSLAGYVQPADKRPYWGGDVAYLNAMLAPVMLLAEGTVLDWADKQPNQSPTERKRRDASAGAAYLYRDTLFATIAGTYTYDDDSFRKAH